MARFGDTPHEATLATSGATVGRIERDRRKAHQLSILDEHAILKYYLSVFPRVVDTYLRATLIACACKGNALFVGHQTTGYECCTLRCLQFF